MSNRDIATSRALRVTVVEDDATTRDALRTLIDGAPGFQCSAAYESVEDALNGSASPIADVILVDVHLPGVSGSEGVRALRRRWPTTEILMLTVYADEAKVFESICNGAVGYLLKHTRYPRLLDAIREAAAGGAPMSPEVARQVVTFFRTTKHSATTPGVLTNQETRVLQLLADGLSYSAAGRQLGISVNTVRTYVRGTYEKLHVHSKSEAVSRALRNGLIR